MIGKAIDSALARSVLDSSAIWVLATVGPPSVTASRSCGSSATARSSDSAASFSSSRDTSASTYVLRRSSRHQRRQLVAGVVDDAADLRPGLQQLDRTGHHGRRRLGRLDRLRGPDQQHVPLLVVDAGGPLEVHPGLHAGRARVVVVGEVGGEQRLHAAADPAGDQEQRGADQDDQPGAAGGELGEQGEHGADAP